jgi:voltage-gated potassium channel Kch
MWTLVAVVLYSGLFSLVGVDYGEHSTWLSPIYFSVVTLTTLGYGDVTPASVGGQLVAMAAVVTGYFMLGGLLSILSNKMARRGD